MFRKALLTLQLLPPTAKRGLPQVDGLGLPFLTSVGTEPWAQLQTLMLVDCHSMASVKLSVFSGPVHNAGSGGKATHRHHRRRCQRGRWSLQRRSPCCSAGRERCSSSPGTPRRRL